ncbi:MAG: acetate--CoA ligase family protein [Rhodospirillales bacterium]|nr:acetate--CoA ligase family protein [Rhodospirillales bacterium]
MDIGKALFNPQSIALIGASGDGKKNAGRPQRYLSKHGYTGHLYPVNPYRDEVQGLVAYKSVRDIPGPVDHALIMTPADTVVDVLTDCAAAGVRVATLYSDGFAETGAAGEALQQRIVDIARAHDMRLLGPNSMGVINTHNGMTLSVNAVLEMEQLPAGRISVVSQSGTVLGTLLSRGAARGIGFSKLVSLGNEADLSAGEVMDLLVDDPDTDAILLFLEGIRDAKGLARAARRAQQNHKPVLVYKLGKSAAGRQLAVSHSGALASPARTTDAFFRAHGLIPVDMLETLFEMPLMVTGRPPRPGNRVSVITTTGGGAAMVADRLGSQGLELVGPSEALRDRLRGLNIEIGAGPLIDLTMAGTRDGVYGAALDEVLADPRADAVVCVVGSSGQFHPELAVAPIIRAATSDKFVAAFIAPQADQSLARLQAAGIAAFRTPEACADAVAAALAWTAPDPVPDIGASHIPVKSTYNEQDALALFAALGIAVVKSQQISKADDLDPSLSFPVVAKILSDAIAHKSEVGGVRVGLANGAALAEALTAITTSVRAKYPDLGADRFLIQTMETGIAEVLLGYRRDPEVGPVVILGAGGLLAEILDDVAIAVAPLNLTQAMDLIARVKGLALLQGYRGQPRGDVDALARAIVAISHLAAAGAEHIAEAEINPLLVKAEGEGVVALDGLVRTGS